MREIEYGTLRRRSTADLAESRLNHLNSFAQPYNTKRGWEKPSILEAAHSQLAHNSKDLAVSRGGRSDANDLSLGKRLALLAMEIESVH